MFKWVASRFSNSQSFEYEVIAAGASGDLGYLVGIEHTTASVGDAPPEVYELRVTTIFRREDEGHCRRFAFSPAVRRSRGTVFDTPS